MTRARQFVGGLILLSSLWASFSASALQSVTLAWDANSETNLAGYKVYYGGGSRAYTNVVSVGNALTASLNLLEGGTYYFAVTAVNTQGAESDYSAEVTHDIPAIRSTISISTVGSGTINPNLNGQLLNVGWPYTVRAMPASGHAFRNWSGDISSTAANLTFVMQSNLTLVANFYDNARPQIAITSPTGNVRVTNGAVAISGTASDNVGLSQVLYRFGNSPFQPAVGTTSWSVNAPLAAGLNVVEVKSIDTTGNESVVLSRSITNVMMAPIIVNLVGSGTITPNYNGQLLEVGRSYTMSARAGTGFTFSNWSGGVDSTSSQITFVMQQGLSVTANFTDASSPTISVAAPLSGTRTTNSIVTVRGSASDNASIARVLCKVNDGPFEVANGTTSWSGNVLLRPGTNRICVKAVDASGRESAELSRTVTYVVNEPIGLTINGRGTITRRISAKKTVRVSDGQMLEIGKRYTLTATPAAGFIFTNWTGTASTNRRTITFTMQSNTVLAANFVDVRRPSVVIAYPVANARLTNSSITVRGRAYDNLNVAQVLVSLNDGAFQPAIGTTNWSLPINLVAGLNRIRVKSLDVTGFESGVSNRTVTHVVMLPMIVGTSGSGTLTPNLNGKLLELGRKYTMTATPSAGYILSNWVGSVASESAALTFTMHSNANVTAQFVPNPFPTVQGTYNGLYYEEDGVEHHSSGFLRVTVTDRGSFSASLRSAGRTNAFTGQFNAAGRVQKTVSRTGLPALTVDLQLPLGTGREELSGTISDGSWSASYLADRSGWNTTNNPFQGRYTVVLPGQTGNTSPAGHGYGSAIIDRAGNLLLSGRSGDGQTLSQSVPLSRSGEWPLYVPLYSGKGSILSWLTFTNDPAAPVHGLLSWIKSPSTASAFYRAGFSNEVTVLGSAYVAATTNRVIRMDEGAVIATDGNLPYAVTNIVRLTPTSTISATAGTGFTMTLDRTTGKFSGTFRIPGTSTSRTFYGSLLQNLDEGCGYFLGTDQSGQIRFIPLSQPAQ